MARSDTQGAFLAEESKLQRKVECNPFVKILGLVSPAGRAPGGSRGVTLVKAQGPERPASPPSCPVPWLQIPGYRTARGRAREGGTRYQSADLQRRLSRFPKLSVPAESWPGSLLCPPHAVPTQPRGAEFPGVQPRVAGGSRARQQQRLLSWLVTQEEQRPRPTPSLRLLLPGNSRVHEQEAGASRLPLRMPAFRPSLPSGPRRCPG